MDRCRAEHFAVGAFNLDNQETLLAIVRAAKAKHAPVLAELSDAEATTSWAQRPLGSARSTSTPTSATPTAPCSSDNCAITPTSTQS